MLPSQKEIVSVGDEPGREEGEGPAAAIGDPAMDADEGVGGVILNPANREHDPA